MLRVLIVDDDARDLAQIQAAVVKECGNECQLTVARTEIEAYESIDEGQRFDMAVIDLYLSLPEKPYGQEEGFRVISRLHENQPDCRIIAKTTRMALSDARRALQYGASDVISSKWDKLDYSELLQQRISFWNRMIAPTVAIAN